MPRSMAIAYSDQFAPMIESDDWVLPRLVRAEILLSSNRPAEAADIYRRLYEAKDSTFSKDMRMQLDELNTLFRVDELKIQNQLVRSRYITGFFAFALIGTLIFFYFRHRSAKRLAELKSAKERIENELRIARDIQMSMVPHVFPDREGVDLYALMQPALQQFGEERQLNILRHTNFESAQQIVKTLEAEVEKHRNGAEPNDDLTMLCLNCT